MTERKRLLQSIATTVADYRAGELAPPTPEHVERWIRQFTGEVQTPLLRELDHVLRTTYFSRRLVEDFLDSLVENRDLAGGNPRMFWSSANLLDIQQNGNSQREMLEMLAQRLEAKLGLSAATCGSPGGAYVYLDDVIFSGNRVAADLEAWIGGEAPSEGLVNVIVIASHAGGEWEIKRRLSAAIASAGKKIVIRYWRAKAIENRKTYKRNSEVLWPVALPNDDDVIAYLALNHRFPFEPRIPGGMLGPFSSEQGRQLLEHEMLLAGVKIRASCANPKEIVRPLGFGRYGVGCGSMIVTFRNCPNNCPLALWWGDPHASISSPLSKWYPLVLRKTYSKEEDLPW